MVRLYELSLHHIILEHPVFNDILDAGEQFSIDKTVTSATAPLI